MKLYRNQSLEVVDFQAFIQLISTTVRVPHVRGPGLDPSVIHLPVPISTCVIL